MDIREDPWLSARLGRPTFTIDPEGARVDAAVVESHARGRVAATYQARVPSADTEVVASLEDAGLRVVNAGLNLARDPGLSSPAAADRGPDAPFEVRVVDAARDREVLNVAERCFTTSRFHLDPAIPSGFADGLKREWIDSYLRGERGEHLLVAVRGARVVGFLAVILRRDGADRVLTIDLIGVEGAERGTGAGRRLVERFLDDSRGGCERVEVGTQAANEPAIRFYERLGFAVRRTFYDLHMHVGAAARGV